MHVPFHSQEWSISNFPRGLTKNTTSSHSMENLTFHSFMLRGKMILLPNLTTSPMYTILFLKVWRIFFFNLEVKGSICTIMNDMRSRTPWQRDLSRVPHTKQPHSLWCAAEPRNSSCDHSQRPDNTSSLFRNCSSSCSVWAHFRQIAVAADNSDFDMVWTRGKQRRVNEISAPQDCEPVRRKSACFRQLRQLSMVYLPLCTD